MRSGVLAATLSACLAATPLAAQENAADCAGLTRHFVLCDAGTDWATAEWEQFGDGAALHLGEIDFDWAEDWAGRDDAATPEVEDALAAILSGSDRRAVLEAHLTDRIDTPHATVARTIQTESYDGDPPQLRAWMVAATPDHRVMLILTASAETPVTEIEARSREIAGLVREAPSE